MQDSLITPIQRNLEIGPKEIAVSCAVSMLRLFSIFINL